MPPGSTPRAYAASAKALARELESYAELVHVGTSGVTPDGTINGFKTFKFRSAKAIASTDPARLNCISVDVQPWGEPVVRASSASSKCERARVLEGPKCTLAGVMARLAEAPSGEVHVQLDDRGWQVHGPGINEFVPDDC